MLLQHTTAADIINTDFVFTAKVPSKGCDKQVTT